MCRTTLFEPPAITFPAPGPHMLAAMVALSDELLQRVPLARAELAEHVGETSGDDSAISRIDLSYFATEDEVQSVGLPPPTVDDDLALAEALAVVNAAHLARLGELETEAGTEESALAISQIIEERLMWIQERMRRRGASGA